MTEYQNCTLCPRLCGVDRTAGELGFCAMPDKAIVAKTMLHYWEEPVLAGAGGSGAIFFSGCTLGCSYCQNAAISQNRIGQPMGSHDLRSIMEELIAQGAENIDLVTPSHYLPDILPALRPKLPVPVVYNCGGYERAETLVKLEGLVDIYLPDLKYATNALAMELSQAEDYFEVASSAIQEMVRQTGPVILENGKLKRGVLVRHLILPGQVENSLRILDYLGEAFPKGTLLVSLMRQYTPMPATMSHPSLCRTVTHEEYDAVLSWMYLNQLNGFTQDELSASRNYIPSF